MGSPLWDSDTKAGQFWGKQSATILLVRLQRLVEDCFVANSNDGLDMLTPRDQTMTPLAYEILTKDLFCSATCTASLVYGNGTQKPSDSIKPVVRVSRTLTRSPVDLVLKLCDDSSDMEGSDTDTLSHIRS